jgi:hypothetical protein
MKNIQIKRIMTASTTGPYPYVVVELKNGKHEQYDFEDFFNILLSMINENKKEKP